MLASSIGLGGEKNRFGRGVDEPASTLRRLLRLDVQTLRISK
jgi:hypothetical protein